VLSSPGTAKMTSLAPVASAIIALTKRRDHSTPAYATCQEHNHAQNMPSGINDAVQGCSVTVGKISRNAHSPEGCEGSVWDERRAA